tara:strand:- start:65 stop:367 length:303 start_codon:yes stop_codon:yes gene_type:complete
MRVIIIGILLLVCMPSFASKPKQRDINTCVEAIRYIYGSHTIYKFKQQAIMNGRKHLSFVIVPMDRKGDMMFGNDADKWDYGKQRSAKCILKGKTLIGVY